MSERMLPRRENARQPKPGTASVAPGVGCAQGQTVVAILAGSLPTPYYRPQGWPCGEQAFLESALNLANPCPPVDSQQEEA
jgi:hypothetical protein